MFDFVLLRAVNVGRFLSIKRLRLSGLLIDLKIGPFCFVNRYDWLSYVKTDRSLIKKTPFSKSLKLNCVTVELHFSKFHLLLFRFFHLQFCATLKQTQKHQTNHVLNIKSMHVILCSCITCCMLHYITCMRVNRS